MNLIIFFLSHLKIGVSALFGFLTLFSILQQRRAKKI
mgnify:CR=1 FL=1